MSKLCDTSPAHLQTNQKILWDRHPNIMRYYISWAHYKFKSSSRNATYWVLEKSKIKTLKFIMKHQNQGIFTATHFQKCFYVPWLKDVSKYFPIF